MAWLHCGNLPLDLPTSVLLPVSEDEGGHYGDEKMKAPALGTEKEKREQERNMKYETRQGEDGGGWGGGGVR